MKPAERIINALNYCHDYSLGTLWKVKEKVWKEKLRRYDSIRQWHPGLSICRKQVTTLDSTIPMLYGSSSKSRKDNVVVLGLTSDRGPFYPTYFGRSLGAVGIEAVLLTSDAPEVEVNEDKPQVTTEERRELLKFLARKGIRS